MEKKKSQKNCFQLRWKVKILCKVEKKYKTCIRCVNLKRNNQWGWCSTTSSQHHGGAGRSAVNRSRRQSIQHRQFRRNYGVSSAQGDGQTLLPLPSTNNTNLTHHHTINTSSSSEPSRRVPTSNSTTTNNHHRSLIVPQVQQGTPYII